MITVEELREAIADLPDTALVVGSFGMDADNLTIHYAQQDLFSYTKLIGWRGHSGPAPLEATP